MTKSILFILNPKSGINRTGRDVKSLIGKEFENSDIEYKIVNTERKYHATELAKEAVDHGVDIVCIAGGDGSVHEVAKALVNSPTALGIIPCGSGNGFARSLSIPLSVTNALRSIKSGNQKLVDVISINDDICINVAGIGFDSHITKLFNNQNTRGLLGYVSLVIKEWFSFQEFPVELHYDDKDLTETAFIVAIANTSQYGNNAFICPKADPCDGKLEIALIKKPSLLYAPILIYKLFNKSIDSSNLFQSITTPEITINGPKDIELQLDGESPEKIPNGLKAKILPEVLRVVV